MTTRRQEDDRPFESLMQAVQDGDAQAYVQLLKEITPRLQQMVRRQRRFLAAADVDDIVQEILISLHAVRATYDPRRPFMPWLMAIARNRLADSGRRYARQNAHEVQVDELPVTFSEEGTNIRKHMAIRKRSAVRSRRCRPASERPWKCSSCAKCH